MVSSAAEVLAVEVVAMKIGKCFQRFVQSVAKIVKYRLDPLAANPYYVAIVLEVPTMRRVPADAVLAEAIMEIEASAVNMAAVAAAASASNTLISSGIC